MAVHMVRVFVEPPKGEAGTAINNWVSNYSEWNSDPVTHELTETNTEIDGTGIVYLRGDWRFEDQGETPTAILEDLSNRLQSFQGGLWHRLGYHICDHDGDPDPDVGPGCAVNGWENVVEHGTIPSGVPDFDVSP